MFEIGRCPHCGAERQEWARLCGKCGKPYLAPPVAAHPAEPTKPAEPAGPVQPATLAARAARRSAPGLPPWLSTLRLPRLRLATPPTTRMRLLAAWFSVEFVGAAVLYGAGAGAIPAMLWLVVGCCACQAAIILGA